MKPIQRLLTVTAALAAVVPAALSAPTPVSGPLSGDGTGLNSKWVQVEFSINPHNPTDARSVLGKGPGDAGYVSEASLLAPVIDYADQNGLGGFTPDVYVGIPFGPGDAPFAVEYTGYLNIVEPGPYQFAIYHDDGFQLSLGGELIAEFPFDTGPRTTFSDSYLLEAGLYPISFLGWEQGGLFINELAWRLAPVEADERVPGTDFSIIPTLALFPNTGIVPETSTWLGAGVTVALAGLAAWRRRR